MITFTSYGKAMNYWQKKLLTFLIIQNTRWLIQNLHIGTLLLFHIILQIFHLFLLKALFPSLFNHSRFLLGKTSAQNSCFSPSAHKSSVTSAPVKNVSSFSSNSANSLCSRACLAICKANSNPKSNLVLKDNSKSHILPVFVKPAISCVCF